MAKVRLVNNTRRAININGVLLSPGVPAEVETSVEDTSKHDEIKDWMKNPRVEALMKEDGEGGKKALEIAKDEPHNKTEQQHPASPAKPAA